MPRLSRTASGGTPAAASSSSLSWEWVVVALGLSEPLRDAPRQYLNRLSDLLFVLARVLNRMDGGDDVYWKSERMAQAAQD